MPPALVTSLKALISSLNFYDSRSGDTNIERVERISTQIYIVLMAIGLTILLIHTSIAEETSTITIRSPSQTTIERLFEEYPESLNCPCTNIAIPYDTFVQVNVTYHQVRLSSS